MLHLTAPTADEWIGQALSDHESLLLDHAHCEKKAASTAINLIFRYTQHLELMAPLSALAREELSHFELMLGVLEERRIPFRRLEPSNYAPRLLAAARKKEPHRLLDTLLCCALIEARSCERIQLLGVAFESIEPDLSRLYHSLFKSEARHHGTYVDLAIQLFDKEKVRVRLQELSLHEASILGRDEPALRFHS
jgi:tRNA-(ms[2]io[6]A)-hydroxylase